MHEHLSFKQKKSPNKQRKKDWYIKFVTYKRSNHWEESCKCFCRPLPGTKYHTCCPKGHQTGQRENGEHHSVIVRWRTRLFHDRYPFSMKEMKDALKKVKTRKAPGPDGIKGEMLKHLGACFRAVLLKIFNHNWMKGVVPAVWQEAAIIPVPNKGKDKNPHSYRPISLLSCVGKLLERIVNQRLISHLESNSVLSPTQTRHRKFWSTEDQLASLAKNNDDAFQEKQKVLAVFLDFLNSSDQVWKEALLVNYWGMVCIARCICGSSTSCLQGLPKRSLMAFSAKKKVCLREGVLTSGWCSVSHTVLGPSLMISLPL